MADDRMKRKRRPKVKKKRVVKKRRVWSDGTAGSSRVMSRFGDFRWLGTIAIVAGSAVVVLLTTLYFAAEIPDLESFTFGTATTTGDAGRNMSARPAANETLAASAAAAPGHAERNLAQENLQVSMSGKLVMVVNEGEIPIHLTKLVLNSRYRVAGCDTDANLSPDPNKPPDYSDRVDQVLQIGDSYQFPSHPVCGVVVAVEVHTDQGNAMLRPALPAR